MAHLNTHVYYSINMDICPTLVYLSYDPELHICYTDSVDVCRLSDTEDKIQIPDHNYGGTYVVSLSKKTRYRYQIICNYDMVPMWSLSLSLVCSTFVINYPTCGAEQT